MLSNKKHSSVSQRESNANLQTSTWNVEDTGKWKTEDSDSYFYKIEETKNDNMDKNKT